MTDLDKYNNWNDLQNKHAGQVGLIIGNGPSLRDVPLEFLKKYPSFGTNRIYLLDGFQPTYYVSVNPLVIEQSTEQIHGLNSIRFLPKQHAINDDLPLVSYHSPTFSMNPRAYIYEGYTVTYVCMQLAYFMGFDTVLLVGVDHRFEYHGSPNEEVVSKGPDPNHFHPDYFGKGVKWNNPDLARSELAYRMAQEVFYNDGRKIINLTKGSALEVFEKGNINDW
jgi:hypothetical protein